MTIELKAGDVKELNVSLQPIAGPVEVELIGVYMRAVEGHQYAETSIYHSGWIHVSPIGIDNINLEMMGIPYQVGAVIRNPTSSRIRYLPAIEHQHWYMANGQAYTDWLPLEMGIDEPLVYPPAPTGMPFSGGEYQADLLLSPTGEGTELEPGETGFAYTNYFSPGRRWNYYRLHLIANGVDLGVFEMFGGWAGY